MSGEALLAAGYAAFLVLAALALDALARHSNRRSDRFRTAGFAFHEEFDAWRCPEGEFLHRIHIDTGRRLVRYRARAAACNACPAKHGCTDSDQGREVVRPLDPWPHSEAGRFHRGISVVLTALAALVTVAAIARNAVLPELALLAGALVLSVAAAHLARAFIATPTGFPDARSLEPLWRAQCIERRPVRPENECSLTIR